MSAFWTTMTTALALVVHARIPLVAFALLIELSGLGTMALRWRLLMVKLGIRPRFRDTLLTYSAGVFVCNVTPARTIGGDATRAALINPKVDAPGKLVAASVVYDRATDAIGILVVAVVALPVLWRSSSGPIVVGVLALAVLALALPAVRKLAARRVGKWHEALVGAEHTGGMGGFTAVAVCSIAAWLQDVARILVICATFNVTLSPSQAATLTLIRLTSTIVPVPAGLGVADGAMVAGLVWFGVPVETAGAIAILERAILYGWSTLLGAISLVLLGGTKLLRSAGKA
ncbi:MAG TPA: flippase-like domain-containing protein [Vicinamibacterales bacterium]|jgi:hypothetical protein|nr:flippase-like domain-containing protein [Vicinamibacterales bacterium]